MPYRSAAIVLVIALVSSACGFATEQHAVEVVAEEEVFVDPPIRVPDAPVSGEPGHSPEEAQLVEPTPGMEGVHPVEWDAASMDGTTVEVSWWSGVEPCTVLDRVEVDETEDVVTITLFEGSEPSDEEVGCIMIAQRKRTLVELSEPVGTRHLADGAEA